MFTSTEALTGCIAVLGRFWLRQQGAACTLREVVCALESQAVP
jgi:hypothetical protein